MYNSSKICTFQGAAKRILKHGIGGRWGVIFTPLTLFTQGRKKHRYSLNSRLSENHPPGCFLEEKISYRSWESNHVSFIALPIPW